MTSPIQDAVETAVRQTIETHPLVVTQWLAGEPGSWGFLAGKAVIACRQRVGRTLTDAERRQVWAALWKRLTEQKGPAAGSS